MVKLVLLRLGSDSRLDLVRILCPKPAGDHGKCIKHLLLVTILSSNSFLFSYLLI